MELYIGGYAQGKKEYVFSRKANVPEPCIVDELHMWYKRLLRDENRSGENAEQVILSYCTNHPDCILICDEIGNGIVPIDPFERTYRERLGRLLIDLAKRADHVERVVCGIGQVLK